MASAGEFKDLTRLYGLNLEGQTYTYGCFSVVFIHAWFLLWIYESVACDTSICAVFSLGACMLLTLGLFKVKFAILGCLHGQEPTRATNVLCHCIGM